MSQIRVFISFSGEVSHKVARLLSEFIGDVLQPVETFVSDQLKKGTPWLNELHEELSKSDFGICCITPDNLKSQWLAYEVSAIANQIAPLNQRIAPLLLGVSPSEIYAPLSLFQAVLFDKENMKGMIESINEVLGQNGPSIEPRKWNRAFDDKWPNLKQAIDAELSELPDKEIAQASLETRILEEVLYRSRSNETVLHRISDLMERGLGIQEKVIEILSSPSKSESDLANVPRHEGVSNRKLSILARLFNEAMSVDELSEVFPTVPRVELQTDIDDLTTRQYATLPHAQTGKMSANVSAIPPHLAERVMRLAVSIFRASRDEVS